jgi:hypothetical protein
VVIAADRVHSPALLGQCRFFPPGLVSVPASLPGDRDIGSALLCAAQQMRRDILASRRTTGNEGDTLTLSKATQHKANTINSKASTKTCKTLTREMSSMARVGRQMQKMECIGCTHHLANQRESISQMKLQEWQKSDSMREREEGRRF